MIENKLIYGDGLEVMAGLSDRSIHLVLTDIPYDVINREDNGLRNLDKGDADRLTFELSDFMDQVIRVCGGSIYIFCSTEQVSYIRARMVEAKMSTRLGVWSKTNPSPMNGDHIWLSSLEVCVYGKKKGSTFNLHCKKPLWEYPIVSHHNRTHPTQKPTRLASCLINASSKKGDIVLDPCMGTGCFPLTAGRLMRRYVGIDNNASYVVQARRFEVNFKRLGYFTEDRDGAIMLLDIDTGIFQRGKHQGERIEDVARCDPDYLSYLVSNACDTSYPVKAFINGMQYTK